MSKNPGFLAIKKKHAYIFTDAVTPVINDSLRTLVDNWDPLGSLSYLVYPLILPLSQG